MSKTQQKGLEKPDKCILCYEKLDEKEPLDCGHWMHLACVKKHFKPECPVCRAKLNIKVTGTAPNPYIPFRDENEPPQRFVAVSLGAPIRTPQGTYRAVFGFLPVIDVPADDWPEDWPIPEAEPWELDGYNYREEHPDYDEENPLGDDVDY